MLFTALISNYIQHSDGKDLITVSDWIVGFRTGLLDSTMAASFAHILKRLRGGEIVKWGKEINVIPPTIIIMYKYSSIVLI